MTVRKFYRCLCRAYRSQAPTTAIGAAIRARERQRRDPRRRLPCKSRRNTEDNRQSPPLAGACIYEVPVPVEALHWHSGEKDATTAPEFAGALAALVSSSLVYEGESTDGARHYAVHPWTAQAIQQGMKPEVAKERHERAG